MNHLLELPLDIWSVIFSFNFDLYSVKIIRQVSKKLNYLVTTYLQRLYLEEKKNNNVGETIPVTFIKHFNRLTYISPDYPLYMEEGEEEDFFSTLSKISLLKTRITLDTHNNTASYSLIEQFTKAYFSTKRKNYKITFFQEFGNVKLTFIDEGIILDTNQVPDDNLYKFAKYYPVYHYTGEMGLRSISPKLRFMPHLKVINVVIYYQGCLDWLPQLLITETPRVEEINLVQLNISKSRKYKSKNSYFGIKGILKTIIGRFPNLTFPHIRKFLPIHCDDLNLIQRIFPSLEEICFLTHPDSSLYPSLRGRYRKIGFYLGDNKKGESVICDLTTMIK